MNRASLALILLAACGGGAPRPAAVPAPSPAPVAATPTPEPTPMPSHVPPPTQVTQTATPQQLAFPEEPFRDEQPKAGDPRPFKLPKITSLVTLMRNIVSGKRIGRLPSWLAKNGKRM